MAKYSNQHFVPRFYFGMFTGGDRRIQVLLTKQDRIIFGASIKGQCAAHKFYGEQEKEQAINSIETRHADVLKRLIRLAWDPKPCLPEPADVAVLWEAVLFQHARTELEMMKHHNTYLNFFADAFKQHLKVRGTTEGLKILAHLERDDIQIVRDPKYILGLSITTALESVLLISDLDFHLLRNHTDYPFVFSDSPVVFVNTYYQNVTERGVLGYQTPGLQIFYPLDSKTLLMLVDQEVYSGPMLNNFLIDVTERSDVSQLNSLQLHHSLGAVYFANAKDADYVRELWEAHRSRIIQPKSRFEKKPGWFIDGKPVDGELFLSFEPQLNTKIKLSFVDCNPIKASEYRFRRRSPELVEAQNARNRMAEQ